MRFAYKYINTDFEDGILVKWQIPVTNKGLVSILILYNSNQQEVVIKQIEDEKLVKDIIEKAKLGVRKESESKIIEYGFKEFPMRKILTYLRFEQLTSKLKKELDDILVKL